MANMTIDEATEDDVIGGSEYMPASDGGAPKKIKTSQVAAYVLKCLRESGEQDFAMTGTVSWKTSGGTLKFSSGAKFAQAIIAYAFASAGIEDEDIAELESDETVFVVKVGDEEHVMTLAQLTAYLSGQITVTIELYGMASADALSGADLFLVAQGTDGAQTNKKVALSTVRSFILNGIGAYLKDNSTLVNASGDTEQDPEFVFSYKGTTLRKWRLSNMIALAGDVHGPSTTTLGKVPQWSSTQKTLTDGLDVSAEIGANSTDAQLPTAAAVKEYADSAVADRFPNGSTTGNIPTYADTNSRLGTGKSVTTSVAIATAAEDNKIPTEKAVRTAIDAERTYVDNNVKFDVGVHSQGNLVKFGSNGRNIVDGPSITTEVSDTAVATSDSKVPTEKAVRTAITAATSQGVAAMTPATTIRPVGTADDNHIPTEGAVANALATAVKTGFHADGEIPRFDGTGAQIKGGTVLVTDVRAASNASDAAIATEKAVRTAVNVVQTALDNKKLDKLAAPDEGTDLDASTSRHGLMSAADKLKLEGLVSHNEASDISSDLADNDNLLVSDTSASAVKKSAISRIWTYILGKLSSTSVSTYAANASAAAAGLCPALPSSDASSKYLCGDGTWGTPVGSEDFGGTNGSTSGSAGLVPAPAAADANKFLNADGTWKSVEAAAAEDVAPEVLALTRYDVLWVPAGAITPNATSGAEAEVLTRANNLVAIDTLRFVQNSDTFADFDVVFPDDWNGGVLKLKFYWTPRSSGGTAGQVVRMGAKARFFADGGAITDNASSWQIVDDAMIAYDYEHVTSAMSLAVDGTYAAGKRVHFWIKRNGASDSDTLDENVSLLGVAIQFARAGGTGVW